MAATEEPLSRGLSDGALTGKGLGTVDETSDVSQAGYGVHSRSMEDRATSGRHWEGEEMPVVRFATFNEEKKGEDVWITLPDVKGGMFKAFGVFDGHNGGEAAQYCKQHLVNNVLDSLPEELDESDEDKYLVALQRAMLLGFVKCDKDFSERSKTSGTTATLVLIHKWTVTVAAVGDSRCILDSPSKGIAELTMDHRLETNTAEVNRLESSGGKIGRICTADGYELGPLRCWPGGLCLSRSIGDFDVGEFIVPVPHVKQLRLPVTGGRLIMASDGVWDSVSSKRAATIARGYSPEDAAKRIVRDAIRKRGLRDDTTCVVVDILSKAAAGLPIPKKSVFNLFKRRNKSTSDLSDDVSGEVEELFDDDSPNLLQRLDSSIHAGNKLFLCMICKVDISPTNMISVHAGKLFGPDGKIRPGFNLCATCQAKASAMEGEHVEPARGQSALRQEVMAKLGS